MSLNELWEKSYVTIILGKSVNKFSENVFHWSEFEAISHDIFFSWTFDLLLINPSRYLLFGVYFSPHHRNIVSEYKRMKWNQSWNKSKHFQLFLSWNKNKHLHLFFFFFSQFHENIFRSSCSQMFFKIGALKDFAIFWIKKRLWQWCFSVNLNLLIF